MMNLEWKKHKFTFMGDFRLFRILGAILLQNGTGIGKLQPTGLNQASQLILQIDSYHNTSTPTHLRILYGILCVMMTDFRTCES